MIKKIPCTIFTLFLMGITWMIVPVEINAQVQTNSVSILLEDGWLDATDEALFGTLTLQKDSLIDQSDNLQAIIDYVDKNNQKIYIPSGTYILNKSVTLRSGIKLRGDANTPTILKNTSGENVVLSDENYHVSQNIEIQQLFFDGVGIFTRLANDISINDNIF